MPVVYTPPRLPGRRPCDHVYRLAPDVEKVRLGTVWKCPEDGVFWLAKFVDDWPGGGGPGWRRERALHRWFRRRYGRGIHEAVPGTDQGPNERETGT